MPDNYRQFAALARASGGSLRVAGYLGLLLTIAFAIVGLLLIEPFRAGRIPGIYWSLMVYDQVLEHWLGPISAVAVLVVLGAPVLTRQFSQKPRRPMPAPLKIITAILVIGTIAAWGVMVVSSFKQMGYQHEDDLVIPGESYFLASKMEGSGQARLYLVYHCNQVGMECRQIYSEHLTPTGIYNYSVKGKDASLNMDKTNNRLEIKLRHYNQTFYVPLANA